jgi:hypothetical protein
VFVLGACVRRSCTHFRVAWAVRRNAASVRTRRVVTQLFLCFVNVTVHSNPCVQCLNCSVFWLLPVPCVPSKFTTNLQRFTGITRQLVWQRESDASQAPLTLETHHTPYCDATRSNMDSKRDSCCVRGCSGAARFSWFVYRCTNSGGLFVC